MTAETTAPVPAPPLEREAIARAILIRHREVLLLRRVGSWFFFFPGGHLEPGETACDALARELHEELGLRRCALSPCGVVDFAYVDDAGQPRAERNHVFVAGLPPGRALRSREPLALLRPVALDQLRSVDVRPRAIRALVLKLVSTPGLLRPKPRPKRKPRLSRGLNCR